MQFTILRPVESFTLKELKTFWGIASDLIVGQFVPEKEKSKAMLGNLMGYDSKNKGRILLHPVNQKRLIIHVDSTINNLKPYQYYRFKICAGGNTTLACVDISFPIEPIENPYQEIVKNQFYEYSAPKSDITVARLLGEISNRMYSSNDRVFYEILQNADDMPTQSYSGKENPVHIKIQPSESYVVIMYNSQPFSQQDVESITSAAQSTKLYEQKKTGYKGIGFKSIFTETLKYVIIRSGGFQFKFDRSDSIFEDFERMYITDHPWQGNTAESRRVFLKAHEERMTEFMDTNNIPWQLKPIWVDYLDPELTKTGFRKAIYTVAIAIKRSKKDTEAFLADLLGVVQDSRFLLYLRNLTEIELAAPNPILLSSRRRVLFETDFLRETRVAISRNKKIEHDYLVWQKSVACSDEAFKNTGLELRYSTELRGNDTRRIVVDFEGNKRDVPDKLASFSEIQLYFAAPVVDGKIRSEQALENVSSTSFVYTYLPMNDLRIKLPFRISADFVPSSNREQIEGKNVWNHFLFYHIGYQLVQWVAYLAKNERRGNILDLLSLPMDTSDSTIKPIEEWFNKGYRLALSETAFIPTLTADQKCDLVKLNQVILNDTALLRLFDTDFFFAFTGYDSSVWKLPITNVKSGILKNSFFTTEFGVLLYSNINLIDRLSDSEASTLLNAHILLADVKTYQSILECLNQLAKEFPERMEILSNKLAYIRFGEEVLSWKQLQVDSDRLVRSNRTTDINDLLPLLGFKVSDIDVSQYTNLFDLLAKDQTYLFENQKLFSLIAAKTSNHSLLPKQKGELFLFFYNLNGIGPERYANNLALFTDDLGRPQPLNRLISRNVENLPTWLKTYQITISEWDDLPHEAQGYLVQTDTVFSRFLCNQATLAECTQSLGRGDIAYWTQQLLVWRTKDAIEQKSDWDHLPWVYTDDESRFQPSVAVWDHEGLTDELRPIVKSLTGWKLLHPDSSQLVKQWNLRLKVDTLTKSITNTEVTLTETEIWALLCFLETTGESLFFKNWQIDAVEKNYALRPVQNRTIYTATDTVQAYIKEYISEDLLTTVPEPLTTHPSLQGLGVMSGDALLVMLIQQASTIGLAPLLTNRGDSQLYKSYLTKLTTLHLSSTESYTDDSPEIHVLRIIRDLLDSDSVVGKAFLVNIKVDGEALDDFRAFREIITIKRPTFAKSDEFLTAELLPESANRIGLTKGALGAFEFCKTISQKFLRDTIFAVEELKPDKTESEIFRTAIYLTPVQLVFLQMLHAVRGKSSVPFKTVDFFTYWNNQSNSHQAWQNMDDYLTRLHDSGFENSYYDHDMSECVIDGDYQWSDKETLPSPYQQWANSEDRFSFLSQLEGGPNGLDSDIVKLRKALLETDNNTANFYTGKVKNNNLLINTLYWLEQKLDDQLTTGCMPTIKSIVTKTSWPVDQKPVVPIISAISNGEKIYRLAVYDQQEIHTWDEGWQPYETEVYAFLNNKRCWVVENWFPVELDKRIKKLDSVPPIKKLATDILEGASLLNNPCYNEWKSKGEYPIYVVAGKQIPWQIWYEDEKITDLPEGESYYNEATQTTYLTIKTAQNFPLYAPANFPVKCRTELFENLVASQFSQDKPENDIGYNSALDDLKQDQGLCKSEQKDWHAEAVSRGSAHLESEGYNYTNAQSPSESFSTYTYHSEVAGPEGEPINVFYRSARGGLLYMNPGLWKKLANPQNRLVVIYEDGKPRVFSSQEELLKEKYNPYMLYRVINDQKIETVDKVAWQLDDTNSHLLFVTGPKYAERISDLFKHQIDSAPMGETSTGINKLKEW